MLKNIFNLINNIFIVLSNTYKNLICKNILFNTSKPHEFKENKLIQNSITNSEIYPNKNHLLSKFIPIVKSKFRNCVKFIPQKFKFKFLICGDLYIFKDAQILFSDNYIADYSVYVLENNKYNNIIQFNQQRKLNVKKIEKFSTDWILLVIKITDLYDSDINIPNKCLYHEKNVNVNANLQLQIYLNGQLKKTIDSVYNLPKVNIYGELMYKDDKREVYTYNIISNRVRKISDEIIDQYHFDFKYFPYLNYNVFDNNGNVCIYFYHKECDSFYIAKEFCSFADEFNTVQNKFDDDTETINYCAKFKKNRIKDIALLLYILNRIKKYDYAFFQDMFNSNKRNLTCGGTAIYKIPIMDYYKGLEGRYKRLNEISQFYLTNEQKYNYKLMVKNIYNKYNQEVDYTKLPSEFLIDVVPEDLMYLKLQDYIFHNPYKINVSEQVLKEQYNNIKQYLIENGIIKRKWKSEIELFKTVYSLYPDSIYQYRASWLGQQSLDIFIPSLNIGIEYQGIQHYKAISLFGGDEGFKNRIKLDKKKVRLCQENGVKLIEWSYDETISQIILKNKIKEILQ